MTKIACIDFDGTVVDHAFPKIGEPLEGAFDTLKKMKEQGWVLILWTCRENEGDTPRRQYLKHAVDFCRENGVEFDGVNETPLDHEFRDDRGLRRKAYANVYIDDRNFGGFPGWAKVAEYLLVEEQD